jgi:hypothetical protein
MSRAELDATAETGLLRGGREGAHYVSDNVNSTATRAQMRLAFLPADFRHRPRSSRLNCLMGPCYRAEEWNRQQRVTSRLKSSMCKIYEWAQDLKPGRHRAGHPWDFGTQCGVGPFAGTVVAAEEGRVAVLLNQPIRYQNRHLRVALVRARHRDRPLTSLGGDPMPANLMLIPERLTPEGALDFSPTRDGIAAVGSLSAAKGK